MYQYTRVVHVYSCTRAYWYTMYSRNISILLQYQYCNTCSAHVHSVPIAILEESSCYRYCNSVFRYTCTSLRHSRHTGLVLLWVYVPEYTVQCTRVQCTGAQTLFGNQKSMYVSSVISDLSHGCSMVSYCNIILLYRYSSSICYRYWININNIIDTI